MKVKIFEGDDTIKIEEAINKWLDENPAYEILNTNIYATILHELFVNDPSRIANQWMTFVCTIIYDIKK